MFRKKLTVLVLCFILFSLFVIPASADSSKLEKVLTGRWFISNEVDKFGDPTGERMVKFIVQDGTFSNSATRNSLLIMEIVGSIYEGELNYLFFPHEYSADGTAYVEKGYWTIYTKDALNNKAEISAFGSGNVIAVLHPSAKNLHELLLAGETVKFVMEGKGSTTYSFTIPAAHEYEEAYNELINNK